jgi:hypothetical protein
MTSQSSWWRQPRLWVEAFVLVNVAFLALDIYLAHSVNSFGHAAEYVPLYFSLAAPAVLLVGLAGWWRAWPGVWRAAGFVVGGLAILLGLAGVIFHLDSHFFEQRTLKSLVYAAPFAAPLAYTGLGLLLLLNRMVDAAAAEWAWWVLLLALGGFVGNFIFSLTDHAQNGFYHVTEWIPVVSSALAVGFLLAPFLVRVDRWFLRWCAVVLLLQVPVGLLGFYYHVAADLHKPGPTLWDQVVYGAPVLAPLLLPNLVLLALIGLWQLRQQFPAAQAG